jgi:hypothetical protein
MRKEKSFFFFFLGGKIQFIISVHTSCCHMFSSLNSRDVEIDKSFQRNRT